MEAIKSVKLQTLSEFQGKPAKPVKEEKIPAYSNDQDVFRNNFQEAMQWVFNHTTFDPDNEMDQAALASLKTVGVEPGKKFDASTLPPLDGEKLAAAARVVAAQQLDIWNHPEKARPFEEKLFQPKGRMDLDTMVLQSVVGPLGQPASQAMYPAITTTDGQPMNAQHDHVIRMTAEELSPARAFWSATFYDSQHGFFIPNKEKKYSVGLNGGMKLDEKGGIEIYIAAEKPEGVSAKNWLPVNRENIGIDVIMRIYAPDLEKMKSRKAPKTERLSSTTPVSE